MMIKFIIFLNASISYKAVYRSIPARYTNQNKYGMRNHSQNGIKSSIRLYTVMYSFTG